MVENTNQYLEKTEIKGFGGNFFLYKRLENANAVSKRHMALQSNDSRYERLRKKKY